MSKVVDMQGLCGGVPLFSNHCGDSTLTTKDDVSWAMPGRKSQNKTNMIGDKGGYRFYGLIQIDEIDDRKAHCIISDLASTAVEA